MLEPELLIDLEAENAVLRAALARSEGAGVRRDLITQELKHRIGNLLAVVQAVARQTFKEADAASVEDFTARILALGAAQKLLIDSETRAAKMAEVVRGALAPHCIDGERATITGPDLPLDGRRAHGLTLALHELATNAAKYGALSVDGGWVEVVWTSIEGRLDFLWSEHGGPPAVASTRRGFGSRLITRNLGLAFRGEVDLSFRETGVECRLLAPMAACRWRREGRTQCAQPQCTQPVAMPPARAVTSVSMMRPPTSAKT
jgi:two-component sensor histidine kinase